MSSKYEEADLSKVKPISIGDRESKVKVEDFLDPAEQPDGLVSMFPRVLKGIDLRELIHAMHEARAQGRPIIWMIGAHVIKCGLSLYLNRLMRDGLISGLATTGSATVHDLELALFGHTSEDVAVELPAGRFGMSKETAEHFATACRKACEAEEGLGEGVGRHIVEQASAYQKYSVFAEAFSRNIPATVHVALGTDITHQHQSFPSAEVGATSMRDFRILTRLVGDAFDGGVVILFGSAVVLPEVFLKAVSVSYNLGRKPKRVTTASFDMLSQYRVRENVLSRPFQGAGRSFAFTGHHEIMLPLFYYLLQE